MVKSTVLYKLKQNNGEITEFKEEDVECESYDDFLNTVEEEMNRISEKYGRKVSIEIINYKTEEKEEVTSEDFLAKEAVKKMRSMNDEQALEFGKDDTRETIKSYLKEIRKKNVNNNTTTNTSIKK